MNNTVNVSENKKSIFKGTLSMGFATFLSRLLGVVRVRLESTVLGGGEVASAWFLAFAIPNLLRRVLGEGALSNALIPLIAENCVNDGTGRVRKQLAVVFSVLSGILLAIVLLVSLFSIVVVKYSASWGVEFFTHPRIVLTFKLLPLLMPYGLFICLAGVVGAILHYSKIFLLPALAALLLNIVLLGGLSAAWYWSMPETQFLPMLALLVPAAGVLQLLMVAIVLVKIGIVSRFSPFLAGTQYSGETLQTGAARDMRICRIAGEFHHRPGDGGKSGGSGDPRIDLYRPDRGYSHRHCGCKSGQCTDGDDVAFCGRGQL